ncbi:MAG: type VI secretion system baseplate subunit TssF [Planctomycetes bacterium]|nr:type VI secretion system baseplate subunit TssF [Planctomycetota bacterium]
MRDDRILPYFEDELTHVRKAAEDFARRFPAIAARLKLDSVPSQDPHVERLIEAFAFVAARIHRRLDDEYPELTDALLGILYPEYLAPVPAVCTVQFDFDPQQLALRDGLTIPRHRELLTRPVDGIPCRFRTVYPVRAWPLVVDSVGLHPVAEPDLARIPPALREVRGAPRAALRIALRTAGGEPLAEYAIPQLVFHLAEDAFVAHALHAALFRRPFGFLVRVGDHVEFLDATHLRPVGYERDQGLLDYTRTGALGFRLLYEYFAFPEKFLYAQFTGLQALARGGAASKAEITVLFEEPPTALEGRVGKEHMRLGCTPAINLFRLDTTPIVLDQRRTEYPVRPDDRAPHHYEVHSIESVSAGEPGRAETVDFRPFFAIRHGDPSGAGEAYYHARRVDSTRDDGSDVMLTLVDASFDAVARGRFEVLHVRCLCSNRELIGRLAFGDVRGDFTIEGVAAVRRIATLGMPSKVLRPQLGGESRWRLVSHLAVNHLSLGAGGGDGLRALREVLGLYDFANTAVTRQRIEGLVAVEAAPKTRILPGIGPVRGMQVALVFDEQKYTGSSAFLFASVLEVFLGLYATINSFTVVEARTVQNPQEPLMRWPPRIGEGQLL